VKDIILLFKYNHYKVLGEGLARFAYQVLKEEEGLWQKVDALIPVPLHPKRRRKRGFNQALVIAEELEKIRGIEVRRGVLLKIKNVPAQTSLEAEDREKNVIGAFRVAQEDQIKGKRLLLIDDVYTTGATVRECSRVLKKAGAKEVKAITLAQA
jgi:ComF family protein